MRSRVDLSGSGSVVRISQEPAVDPCLGIFGGEAGEEYALMLVASPVFANLVVSCDRAALSRFAVPLLLIAQALLVMADRRLLGRTNAGRIDMPSLWWALFPSGWLLLRARFRTASRPFAGVWLPVSLVFFVPFISMVSSAPMHGVGRAAAAAAIGPGEPPAHDRLAGRRATFETSTVMASGTPVRPDSSHAGGSAPGSDRSGGMQMPPGAPSGGQ